MHLIPKVRCVAEGEGVIAEGEGVIVASLSEGEGVIVASLSEGEGVGQSVGDHPYAPEPNQVKP